MNENVLKKRLSDKYVTLSDEITAALESLPHSECKAVYDAMTAFEAELDKLCNNKLKIELAMLEDEEK